jgi:hypothetical protein
MHLSSPLYASRDTKRFKFQAFTTGTVKVGYIAHVSDNSTVYISKVKVMIKMLQNDFKKVTNNGNTAYNYAASVAVTNGIRSTIAEFYS